MEIHSASLQGSKVVMMDLKSLSEQCKGRFWNKIRTVQAKLFQYPLEQKYFEKLSQKESRVQQQSRITLLIKGDKNSKNFHASLNSRKNASSIRQVMLPDRSRSEEVNVIKTRAVFFYISLINSPFEPSLAEVLFRRVLTDKANQRLY